MFVKFTTVAILEEAPSISDSTFWFK